MLLMIDNYDSFTYNLVQYFGELGADMLVRRNDEITIADIQAMKPQGIVISPGPCTPNEAGISLATIHQLQGSVPILGVCLGHQSIGQAFGGTVKRARQVMHGKTSLVHHNQSGIFAKLPTPFRATRYHSLIVDTVDLPDCFEITAWTQHDDSVGDIKNMDEIMGLRHKTLPIEGVQFHPESILSEHGHALLDNFLKMTVA